MPKMRTERQSEVLHFLRDNPDTPASSGVNVDRRGRAWRFHPATLTSLVQQEVLESYLGNDGATWYRLRQRTKPTTTEGEE